MTTQGRDHEHDELKGPWPPEPVAGKSKQLPVRDFGFGPIFGRSREPAPFESLLRLPDPEDDARLAPRFTHRPGEGLVVAPDRRPPEQRQYDHERLRMRGHILSARLGEDQSVPPFQAMAYQGDCGLDLATTEDATVLPGQTANLSTGVAVALPPATFGWITGRSSTWTKWGLQVMGSIIDEGWRGELNVLVFRPVRFPESNAHELLVPAGTRLGQLIVLPNLMAYTKIFRVLPDDLPESERGTQGYGSTGH